MKLTLVGIFRCFSGTAPRCYPQEEKIDYRLRRYKQIVQVAKKETLYAAPKRAKHNGNGYADDI